MKDFIILKNDNTGEYVCFVNNVEDVEYYLDDISEEIKSLGITKIIIDLFLINGYSYNRFFEFNIKTNELLLINPRNISNDIYRTITTYLKNNIQLLENSALSLVLKKIVLNQLRSINFWNSNKKKNI